MKNRDYKEFSRGSIVHIFNRGNNKEKIFCDEKDYKSFLYRLGLSLGFKEESLKKENLLSLPFSRIRITDVKIDNFRLHSFCLMPNHFHLIIEQMRDVELSKLIQKTCTSYAMYFNKKYKRIGHVFQDKFKAIQIDDDPQLLWTSAYIHMNPVKDKLTSTPEEYIWSSYNDYLGKRNLPIIYKELLLSMFSDRKSFQKETLNYLINDTYNMSRTGLDM